MIPIRLELRNFLAYRDPDPLDLSGLHLACLVGSNGSGKSSLLDAITWALWGKARARQDNDLIHGDEIEAEVRFTFLADGSQYRVTRYRSRKGRGSTELSLEALAGDAWRPLTEATLKATQETIDRVLRLDYSTFINSAYLVQGRADEFTRKTPSERKRILSDILGLEIWAEYEERAREKLRALEVEQRNNEARVTEIDREIALEGQYQELLSRALEQLQQLTEETAGAESRFRELEAARQRRSDLETRYAERQGAIARDQQEIAGLAAEHARLEEKLAAARVLLQQQQQITADFAALEQTRADEHAYSEALIQQSALAPRLQALEQEILGARSELDQQRSAHRQQVESLQRTMQEAGDPRSFEEARAEVEAQQVVSEQLDQWREQREQRHAKRGELDTQRSRKHDSMQEFRAQLDLLEGSDEPLCPTCGQPLSDDLRAGLIEQVRSQGSAAREEWKALAAQLERFDQESVDLDRRIRAAELDLRKLPALQRRFAQLEERLGQASRAAQELESAEAALAAVEARIVAEDYAHEARSALHSLHGELAALGYDEAAHRALRAQLEQLSHAEARYRDLERAMQEAPELDGLLEQLAARTERWQASIDKVTGELAEIEARIVELDLALADYAEVEAELNRLRMEKQRAGEDVIVARQHLATVEQNRQRRSAIETDQARIGEEQSIYQELRLAFGKNGIPAMIIEAAIPEIENEANRLLSELTSGRMHLRFDTQREKVTGGALETLDIRIADELGTRDYETFSGGEAFRVNFAIRLALSRLLARRAGTQLRTLFIDEGFGALDEVGRDRLIEALNAIQDEFDLVLVITHIEELKDAFPARIEITKTRMGSQIQVL